MKLAATVIAVVLALTAEAAAKSTQPALLAVVWASGGPTEIVQLDPLSLKSVSRRVRVSEPAWFIARSPARDRAAFMIGRNQDRLRFLDVRRMRITGGIRVSGVRGTLWRDAHRLVLVADGERATVLVVDPITRRVQLTRALAGRVASVARSGPRLVALLTPRDRIGAARLAVVGPDGDVREVALPGIRGGSELVDPDSYALQTEVPAVAVNAAGSHAVIVPASGALAEVELDTLRVLLHPANTRTLAARKKSVAGWSRSATWFGPHLVAVTGIDYSRDGDSMRTEPAGLTLLDTRDWSSRLVEPRASSATVADTTLLVCGVWWNPQRQRGEGMGMSGYRLDGTKQFHVLGDADVSYPQVLGSYAYLASDNNTRYTIVDPVRGTVVARVSTRAITTLADG